MVTIAGMLEEGDMSGTGEKRKSGQGKKSNISIVYSNKGRDLNHPSQPSWLAEQVQRAMPVVARASSSVNCRTFHWKTQPQFHPETSQGTPPHHRHHAPSANQTRFVPWLKYPLGRPRRRGCHNSPFSCESPIFTPPILGRRSSRPATLRGYVTCPPTHSRPPRLLPVPHYVS